MNGIEEFKKLLEKSDNYYIFGNGSVGNRLLLLMKEYGFKNKFKGFIVSNSELYNDSSEKYNLYDFRSFEFLEEGCENVVLMSVSETYHPDVYEICRSRFDCVIDAIKYYSLEFSESDNKVFPLTKIEYDRTVVLDDDKKRIRDKIVEDYFSKNNAFGEKEFYQRYPSLGIPGTRPTEVRLEYYGLVDVLSIEQNILDIGCNCGFFDMEISKHVNSITALEYDSSMSEFSARTAALLGIFNIDFIPGDFNQWYLENNCSFDVILSFAVHIWIGMDPETYADAICGMMSSGGFLLFESQDYRNDKKFDEFCDAFSRRGLSIKNDGFMVDDGIHERKFVCFSKG